LSALGIQLLILAQIADYATFVVMVARRGMGAELNPIVTRLFEDHGLLLLTVAKVAAVVLVAATFLVVGRSRPRVGGVVLTVGVVTGGIGALSNLATI
jgi:hypothetical protein